MKNYLATTALAALLAAPFTSEAQDNKRITGEGPLVKETRNVTGFSKITLSSSIDVVVRQGSAYSVEIEAQKNVLPRIETEVRGNELIVDIKGWVNTDKDMKAYITLPKLEGVSSAGSGDIVFKDDIKTEKLTITLAGSGDAQGMVHADELKASLAGSGDVKLSGSAAKATVSGVGSGDFNAPNFESRDWQVNLTGSGDAKIKATGDLKASLTGSGDLKYSGDPKSVKVNTTGSGEVSKL